MAWECMFFADTGNTDIADLTEKQMLPMGTKKEIRLLLHRVFQGRQWNSENVVRLNDGGYIEFHWGDSNAEGDILTTLTIRSNASEENILAIGHLCEQLHWMCFDFGGSPLMRTAQEISHQVLGYINFRNTMLTERNNKS